MADIKERIRFHRIVMLVLWFQGGGTMTANSMGEYASLPGDALPKRLLLFFRRLRANGIRGIAIATLIATGGSLSPIHAKRKQGSTTPQNTVAVVVRPCNSIPAGSKRKKGTNKTRSQKRSEVIGNTASTCIEVHSTALDVQEYLQTHGREEKWNLGDEHVAEDAWTFSRKLERDDLLHFTKQDANPQPVNWTSGAAFVQVSTLELDVGFVRVQISARFEGYGQSADRFAPPNETWPLSSIFALDSQLFSMLGIHFKNAS
jgi:hypothetical protein